MFLSSVSFALPSFSSVRVFAAHTNLYNPFLLIFISTINSWIQCSILPHILLQPISSFNVDKIKVDFYDYSCFIYTGSAPRVQKMATLHVPYIKIALRCGRTKAQTMFECFKGNNFSVAHSSNIHVVCLSRIWFIFNPTWSFSCAVSAKSPYKFVWRARNNCGVMDADHWWIAVNDAARSLFRV